MEKFSYSKLSMMDKSHGGCPFRYKLQYVDKHFPNTSSVATEFGTLIHFVEESIGKDIVANNGETLFLMDYQKYANILLDGYHGDENIPGAKELSEKYADEWFVQDKAGFTYADKVSVYLSHGIYRLSEYLQKNPDLEIVGLEQEFNLEYGPYLFHGFIDRVFRDKATNEIFVEDIKTWDVPKDSKELATPLQFVFYSMALQEIYPGASITCAYELPLIGLKQAAGTKGFMERGIKKIDKLLDAVEKQEFAPAPSALCHWCPFCKTFPKQPEEAKNLCPYFSHYTKQNNKDFSVENEWMGIENHQAILEAFIQKSTAAQHTEKVNKDCIILSKPIDLQNQYNNKDRRFILRR